MVCGCVMVDLFVSFREGDLDSITISIKQISHIKSLSVSTFSSNLES